MHPTNALQIIRATGGVCVPGFLLSDERDELLTELSKMTLVTQPETHGPRNVRQSFSSSSRFVAGGHFVATHLRVEKLINEWFGSLNPTPLCKPFQSTDLVVQQYEPGPTGIAPHRDGKKFINLIAIVIVEGQGRFAFCDDYDGTNPRSVTNNPGDLLLMRGVGFDGSDYQPLHLVDHITSRRTTFAMRQLGTWR